MDKTANLLVPLFRVLLGALLLVAGLMKVGEPEVFARSIENYRLLGPQLSGLSALCVPWLEILLGFCLIAGFVTRPSSLLAGGLSVGFGIFVISALVRGLDIDCGCFTGESRVSWSQVVLDFAMIGMAVTIFVKGPGPFSLDQRLADDDEMNSLLAKASGIASGLLLLLNLGLLGSKGLPTLGPPPLSANLVGSDARIIFDPPRVELGEVLQEKGAQTRVTYKNVGTSQARIVDVKSSCNCTVPELKKRTLQPGESAELEINYNPGANRGPVNQSVLLYLEGKVDPVTLQISGEIVPMAAILPGVLKLEPGLIKTVRVVSRRDGYKPKMKGYSSILKDLKLRQVGTAADGSLQIEASVTKPVPKPPHGAVVWTAKVHFEQGPPCPLYIQWKDKS